MVQLDKGLEGGEGSGARWRDSCAIPNGALDSCLFSAAIQREGRQDEKARQSEEYERR
jgi:hypothetical protein